MLCGLRTVWKPVFLTGPAVALPVAVRGALSGLIGVLDLGICFAITFDFSPSDPPAGSTEMWAFLTGVGLKSVHKPGLLWGLLDANTASLGDVTTALPLFDWVLLVFWYKVLSLVLDVLLLPAARVLTLRSVLSLHLVPVRVSNPSEPLSRGVGTLATLGLNIPDRCTPPMAPGVVASLLIPPCSWPLPIMASVFLLVSMTGVVDVERPDLAKTDGIAAIDPLRTRVTGCGSSLRLTTPADAGLTLLLAVVSAGVLVPLPLEPRDMVVILTTLTELTCGVDITVLMGLLVISNVGERRVIPLEADGLGRIWAYLWRADRSLIGLAEMLWGVLGHCFTVCTDWVTTWKFTGRTLLSAAAMGTGLGDNSCLLLWTCRKYKKRRNEIY